MITKFILGTENLDNNYGKLNNFLSFNDFKKSLRTLKKKKNYFIETSLEYKKSISRLEKLNLRKYRIILKLNFKRNDLIKINQFLKKTKIRQIYCIMIHDPDILTQKNKLRIKKILEKLKQKKIAKYFGISLYNFKNIKNILNFFKFNIVQVPLNILDQRLLDKNVIDYFSKKKLIIHARSIFLQGVLLNNGKIRNSFLKKYDDFVKHQKFNKLFHCINFIKQYSFVKKVVIGVNSHQNLIDILECFLKKKIIIDYKNLSIKKNHLIDPNVW